MRNWLPEKGGRKLGGVSTHIDQKDLLTLKEPLEAGRIVPAIDKHCPLNEVPEALRDSAAINQLEQVEEGTDERIYPICAPRASTGSLRCATGGYAQSCLSLLRAEWEPARNPHCGRWRPIRHMCVSGRQHL